MSRSPTNPPWQHALLGFSGLAIVLLLTGVLYWARAIFIPLAMAVFLAYVLSPVVRYLKRMGLPRGPAVILTVAAAVILAIGTGWVLAQQVASLTLTLPDHRDRIVQRISAIKGILTSGETNRLGQLIDEVGKSIDPTKAPDANGRGPTPVVVEPQTPMWAGWLNRIVTPAAEFAVQSAFAAVLVVFILFRKEDLRDRMIRLIGDGRVAVTTKALNDASERVSRYLLKQFLFNATFGGVIAIGLFLIGIRYSLLWGFLAAVMRYVPYLGTWIGVIPPFLYTIATTDTWWQPISVLVVVLGLEIICNNFIEPVVYGSSLGMSEVAQLTAAGFWSFLWGPIGLILSGPLTTCLLVLGKHAPALKFLDVLLGDEPPLDPGTRLYQRLTAGDEDEVGRVLHQAVTERGHEEALDAVVLPALRLVRSAESAGELSAVNLDACLTPIREYFDDQPMGELPPDAELSPARILIVPGKGEIDVAACELFASTLPPQRWDVKVTSSSTLAGEVWDIVSEFEPVVVLIGTIPPGGMTHARYLCKRLRSRLPELKILVGRWGPEEEMATSTMVLNNAGPDAVTTSFSQTRQDLTAWLPVLERQETPVMHSMR
ncbi:MAG TPA: AI-2E family transporter [Fimbriiglobus sp.]|jgi:predicted PurR-regulated permease PerM